ncbi:MAG: NAD(P)/FAD-dependent oxidoreductase [Candidatus Hodarchaeales archaeon]
MSERIMKFDVIIVGGGPAGLSAGIIASNKGLNAAVFEGGTWGGLLSTIYPHKKIYNYPGTPSIRADHLVSEWVRQAADHGVHLVKERISRIHRNLKVETTEGVQYQAKSIILATGMKANELGIPGESKFSKKDRGVYPYVTEPALFYDSRVLVVGGGDTAIDAVIDLENVAKKVFLAHRRGMFRASETNIAKVKQENLAEILTKVGIVEIQGTKKVEKAILENVETKEKVELDIDKIILAVGLKPNTEIFDHLELNFNGKFGRDFCCWRYCDPVSTCHSCCCPRCFSFTWSVSVYSGPLLETGVFKRSR